MSPNPTTERINLKLEALKPAIVPESVQRGPQM